MTQVPTKLKNQNQSAFNSVPTRYKLKIASYFLLIFFINASSFANKPQEVEKLDIRPHHKLISSIYEKHLRKKLANEWVLNAITVQNESHQLLTAPMIRALDQQWRNEIHTPNNRPLIEKLLYNPISLYLSEIKKKGRGLYTEIFITDNKGLNVAQSDMTSDYWQGDEDKWLHSYQQGNQGSHYSEIEFDESSQTFHIQASYTLSKHNQAIGAVTIGFDIDELDLLLGG